MVSIAAEHYAGQEPRTAWRGIARQACSKLPGTARQEGLHFPAVAGSDAAEHRGDLAFLVAGQASVHQDQDGNGGAPA